MDDLIKRQDAIESVGFYSCHSGDKLLFADNALKNIQSVDAVEVVRCKDCKYFELNHWDGIIITAHEICNKWADGCKTNKDGYCFLGERKTNDSQMQSDKIRQK